MSHHDSLLIILFTSMIRPEANPYKKLTVLSSSFCLKADNIHRTPVATTYYWDPEVWHNQDYNSIIGNLISAYSSLHIQFKPLTLFLFEMVLAIIEADKKFY